MDLREKRRLLLAQEAKARYEEREQRHQVAADRMKYLIDMYAPIKVLEEALINHGMVSISFTDYYTKHEYRFEWTPIFNKVFPIWKEWIKENDIFVEIKEWYIVFEILNRSDRPYQNWSRVDILDIKISDSIAVPMIPTHIAEQNRKQKKKTIFWKWLKGDF